MYLSTDVLSVQNKIILELHQTSLQTPSDLKVLKFMEFIKPTCPLLLEWCCSIKFFLYTKKKERKKKEEEVYPILYGHLELKDVRLSAPQHPRCHFQN